MSYRCTHLGHVQMKVPARYYVYVLECPDTEEHRLKDDEFRRIGKCLGGDVLLVGGEDSRLCTEVIHEYSAKWRGDALASRFPDFPVLLVTTVPPDEILAAVAGSRAAPDYGLVALGPFGQREREELVNALCEELGSGRVCLRDLEKDLRHKVLGPLWRRFGRGTKVSVNLAVVTAQFPSARELDR